MCRVELKQAKNTIASQEKMLIELEKTSEAAYREYKELKKQCELEYENRTHVEKIAHNVCCSIHFVVSLYKSFC